MQKGQRVEGLLIENGKVQGDSGKKKRDDDEPEDDSPNRGGHHFGCCVKCRNEIADLRATIDRGNGSKDG